MQREARRTPPGTFRAKDPEQQKKIEELAGIREAYRFQRRIWLWMMGLSLVSSAILLRRGSTLSQLFALVCLGLGLFLTWNFVKCTRVIREIDKGLAPYRVEKEKGSQ
ncbi:MAG: hypothetical protein QHH30_11530 [candidate division NC10 bacterium]|nr:hypothetical protein [candidate division NC10 bacterium]